MFLAFYILMMIGAPCLYCFLWKAIQPGEILGKWQKVIDWVYNNSENLAKFIGDCQICFAHFTAWLSMAIFASISWPYWDFNIWQSIVFILFSIVIMWYSGLAINQFLELAMHKNYLKRKEAESVKEHSNEL